MKTSETDICVIGASLGGVAAAWAAAEAWESVALISEFPWIGGQVSYQGVSCLDENQWIERRTGATRRYYGFCDAIRSHYAKLYGVPAEKLNPGNCWASSLGFEPGVADQILRKFFSSFVLFGKLTIFEQSVAVEAGRFSRDKGRIEFIDVRDLNSNEITRIKAKIFLDATDLGDVLKIANVPYQVGAESKSETGEPRAQESVNIDHVQPFCFPFVAEYCPGESRVIPKPPHYEEFADKGVYDLRYPYPDERREIPYAIFKKKSGLPGSFWEYRSIFDGKQFGGRNDISLINWSSNDFRRGSIIDQPAETIKERLQSAKYQSLGFLYWLQTECPRDDGSGFGYPEFKLRPDLLGTNDGLSMSPYIRESRRIVPRSGRPILEEDISAEFNKGARARLFGDSVGIGHYMIDLHTQENIPYAFIPTKPFQISLGAFIPVGCDNLIPASKNIATTHLTNGAYRLHPIEWAIGEAAGMLAAFSLEKGILPYEAKEMQYLRAFQEQLANAGIPIFWFDDLSVDDPRFAVIQARAAGGEYLVKENSLSV